MEFKKRPMALALLVALAAYRGVMIGVGVYVLAEIRYHKNLNIV
jgi:hypothetical protein